RVPSSQLKTALEDAMQHCGLEDVGKRLIGNLSKGFQQRVGIAQAIIHQPPLVILDEPTVGLDPNQVREIRKLIQSLGQDRSVILSTHILPEVQATCDRVQIIRQGELIYHASIEELNQRGKGNGLTVAFRTPPSAQTLSNLDGTSLITQIDKQRFHIQFEQQNFAEQLVQQAVSNSWGLFELIPQNTSLEEIFVELTTSEDVEQQAPKQSPEATAA
ncbi:MAG: ATP-binding cassette domain-containing protein, partial [Gammaproteobacteria bacterium]|nr:ATP-binding cassette domain-containing protein [Gammaproteobacteria bacterium]